MKEITNEQFDAILTSICEAEGGVSIMLIPGVYEVVSEYFNNDVLEQWRREQEDDEE